MQHQHEHFGQWLEVIDRENVIAADLLKAKEKKKLYKSTHCPKQKPTYSTFTKNVASEIPKDAIPAPKPQVPLRTHKPKLGLQSSKNFVVANAVEVIVGANKLRKNVQQPRNGSNQEFDRYVNKPDFGKRPAYLDDVKQSIAMEKEVLQEFLDELNISSNQANVTESMADADREILIKQLKRKWGLINSHYQKACGGAESNTKKKLKERYERELQQIEEDIKLLSRGRISILME
mmetsp:Transcript_17197/g.30100  ORF Transcript_17197/g.30100 Transcript_17197/m.30100 type:complete len:234 (+) Transcript_17197:67-768(+)|eukprot:CAMPEP_0171487832 /NCGR_PEP_ID=MMETSP0958-20121227/1868_1 /TAXON_ID=87120 /ORGANISM="Aurantiochytrium limacinum, Strain ATCCMYA-1381" /LENGTH=233 /DNA_ID=CAMNT_0012020873 /DNA_START=58 /DNA_END=759 /DNA_ORIENTATION=-